MKSNHAERLANLVTDSLKRSELTIPEAAVLLASLEAAHECDHPPQDQCLRCNRFPYDAACFEEELTDIYGKGIDK